MCLNFSDSEVKATEFYLLRLGICTIISKFLGGVNRFNHPVLATRGIPYNFNHPAPYGAPLHPAS